MGTRVIKVVALFVALLVLLCGCELRKSNVNSAAKKQFTIITSFYPMYISTINITDGVQNVQVINMTKPQTGCLHDYQLSPSDMITLEKGDAFVINGGGMEAFLGKVIAQQPHLTIVDASKNLKLLKDANGEENPHLWVSITQNILQVKNIEEQLCLANPVNADQYKRNAEGYIQKLEALRVKMHKNLEGITHKDIITFHEAFPYFAQEFNLNIVAVMEDNPDVEPTPKQYEHLIELIQVYHIKSLFVEPQYKSSVAQTVAKETGAKLFTLDPVVTGEANAAARDRYLEVMEQNSKILQEALK